MPLVELYNKTGFGRRLRKVLAAATSAMRKIHPQMWSSRAQDGTMTFVGPSISVTGTNGVAISTVVTSTRFSGLGTRTYSKIGSWPGWAALNTSTGDITGTAATGTSNSLRVGCAATGYGSAQSNLFNIVI